MRNTLRLRIITHTKINQPTIVLQPRVEYSNQAAKGRSVAELKELSYRVVFVRKL